MKNKYDVIPDRETEKTVKRLNKVMAGFAAAALVLLIVVVLVVATMPKEDTVKYEGEKYAVLGYPADIFMYDLTDSVECEEDETVPLDGSQWRMVYNNCDVYCHTDDFYDANAYYNNHDNYDWFVIVENDGKEYKHPMKISMDDFEYIYRMEDMEKDQAIFFEEIERMGSLIKVSKDGFIQGTIGLAEYEGDWYWRTEIIDESREKDGTWPEYIIALPEKVSDQIE